jgi:hypothetical protein
MTSYKSCKASIERYFHTENGRKHMKEAQKKYLETDKAKEYNREKALRWYHRQKEYKDEIKRLMAIEIF